MNDVRARITFNSSARARSEGHDFWQERPAEGRRRGRTERDARDPVASRRRSLASFRRTTCASILSTDPAAPSRPLPRPCDGRRDGEHRSRSSARCVVSMSRVGKDCWAYDPEKLKFELLARGRKEWLQRQGDAGQVAHHSDLHLTKGRAVLRSYQCGKSLTNALGALGPCGRAAIPLTSRDRDALGGDVASWRRNIANQICTRSGFSNEAPASTDEVAQVAPITASNAKLV